MRSLDVIFAPFIFALLISGCGNPEKRVLPDYDLSSEFNLDTAQIKYQYYQKFGWGDNCEDIRMVVKVNSSPNLKKVLPIDSSDVLAINKMPNKADHFDANHFTPECACRHYESDIELDFFEFKKDSSLVIQIIKGQYELIETELDSRITIYDSINKLMYFEVHRCNGY